MCFAWTTNWIPALRQARDENDGGGAEALSNDTLLERNLSKTPQLPAMQMIRPRIPHQFHRTNSNQQMLIDAFAVEVIRHARKLDLAV